VAGTPAAEWTVTAELLATLCELVDLSNRLFFAANRRKGVAIPPPIKIRRPQPGDVAEPELDKPASPRELLSFLGGVTVKYTPTPEGSNAGTE
jgi:hypothetical protein